MSDTAPASAKVFTRAYNTTTRAVTLTFDADYWSPGNPAEVLRILRENGFDWTFDTTGYQGASTAQILQRVRQHTVPGATIVMHLSNESTDTAALPSVISTLRSMGYGFTTPYLAVIRGVIGDKYGALGARNSVLGFPRTDETATPDGVGWHNHFQKGSIYWSPETAAHEVHGMIRDKWAALGWGRGLLGYPLSDEVGVTGGRGSQFQGGNVY
ncbi:hypothetical protein [Prauserella flavalba]|nr:hypothetical protein [Prauserella flavalba]